MTTLSEPVAELSAKLLAAKEDTGLSYKQIERAVTRLLGDDAPTHETIRAYHEGRIRADRINDRLVVALCHVYNRPVGEMAPFVMQRFEVLRDLVERQSRWNEMQAGQRSLDEYAVELVLEQLVPEPLGDLLPEPVAA